MHEPAPDAAAPSPERPADRRTVLGLALLSTAAASAVALWGLDGIPHVSDEIAYTLQARLLAAGMRTGPPADQPALLLYPFWQTAPTSAAIFPPGWPALLAIGERLGLPWLINPLLTAVAVLLTWTLGRRLLPPPAALLAAWIMALSPAALLLGASRMAQTATQVGLLAAAALLLPAAAPRPSPLRRLGAGLAVGAVMLIRPYDAALLGGPLLLLGLLTRASARWVIGVGPLLALVLISLDNTTMTGDPLRFPVNDWYDQWVADLGIAPGCNRLGFGTDIGCHATHGSLGHTPAKALRTAAATAVRLDGLLLGAPLLGTLSLLAGLAALRRRALPLLLPPLLIIGGYLLYWSPGLAYGARFWHSALPALVLLAAAGIHALAARWPAHRTLIPLLLAALSLSRLWQMAPDLQGYWCVDDRLHRILHQLNVHSGVLFIEATGSRPVQWPRVGVDAFACDPMLEFGDALWMMDPTSTETGLQPRHAPASAAQAVAFLREQHPQAQAWFARHDVQNDTWEIFSLQPDGLRPLYSEK